MVHYKNEPLIKFDKVYIALLYVCVRVRVWAYSLYLLIELFTQLNHNYLFTVFTVFTVLSSLNNYFVYFFINNKFIK